MIKNYSIKLAKTILFFCFINSLVVSASTTSPTTTTYPTTTTTYPTTTTTSPTTTTYPTTTTSPTTTTYPTTTTTSPTTTTYPTTTTSPTTTTTTYLTTQQILQAQEAAALQMLTQQDVLDLQSAIQQQVSPPLPYIPPTLPIVPTRENKCAKDFEIRSQGENILTSENIASGRATKQTIPGCPFLLPQIIPQDVVRTTVIDDIDCNEPDYDPCPDYALLNGQTINVKNEITNYYQGDINSGITLCNLLNPNYNSDYDEYLIDRCLITYFDDKVPALQAQPPAGPGPLPPLTFLNTTERDSLYFKLPRWVDTATALNMQSKSSGAIVYTSSRQMENTYGNHPTEIITSVVNLTPTSSDRVDFYIYNEITMLMLTPDPALAIQDLQMAAIYTDYYNAGRTAGTFPYTFSHVFMGMTLYDYMPYYHATFNTQYAAGLAYIISSNTNTTRDLDLSHNVLTGIWDQFRRKYVPLAAPLPQQTPIKSPWDPPGTFAMLANMANVQRYALLIRPSQGSPGELYEISANLNLMRHLLVTHYGVNGGTTPIVPTTLQFTEGAMPLAATLPATPTAGDIFTVSSVAEFNNAITEIQNRAAMAKALTTPPTTQLFIYSHTHGAIGNGESLVANAPAIQDIMIKEGGGSLLLFLTSPVPPAPPAILSETDIKHFLKWRLQADIPSGQVFNYNDGTMIGNVIDNVFEVIEACMSGGASI